MGEHCHNYKTVFIQTKTRKKWYYKRIIFLYYYIQTYSYTSISNATLYFIHSPSLLYVSAVPGHHQATVTLT
jgi:Zn-dependent M28 family amino/carboxypeptidase